MSSALEGWEDETHAKVSSPEARAGICLRSRETLWAAVISKAQGCRLCTAQRTNRKCKKDKNQSTWGSKTREERKPTEPGVNGCRRGRWHSEVTVSPSGRQACDVGVGALFPSSLTAPTCYTSVLWTTRASGHRRASNVLEEWRTGTVKSALLCSPDRLELDLCLTLPTACGTMLSPRDMHLEFSIN